MRIDGRPLGLGLLLGLAALLWNEPTGVDHGEGVVEVRGDVPRPGFWLVPRPVHLHEAVRAAGGRPIGPDRRLGDGTRLMCGDRGYTASPSDARLVLGKRLSLNHASADALQQLRGIGPSRAESIVLYRKQRGRFLDVDALGDVRGIGPKTVETVHPFLIP